MTREEAKSILLNAAWLGTDEDRQRTEEAVDMAIKALEQPERPTGRWIYKPNSEVIQKRNAFFAELDKMGITRNPDGSMEVEFTPKPPDSANTLLREATDAIEELQQTAEHYKGCADDWYKEACDYKAMLPRWIPVTEGPPETRKSILGQKSSKVLVAFRYDDGTQGTDTAHTLNGEWVFDDRITVVARTVTHWMSLPEPPKEEGET